MTRGILWWNDVLKLHGPMIITQLKQKPAMNNNGVINMTVSFKTTLIKLGLVNSLRCERHEQASEKVSHILCNCEAMATL